MTHPRLSALLILFLALAGGAQAQDAFALPVPGQSEVGGEASTYVLNLVVAQRADPWVHKHTDGCYYFTGSLPGCDRIEPRRSEALEGEWVEKGQAETNGGSLRLDAATFAHRGTRYLVGTQKDPRIEGDPHLYIAEMENPWTIEGGQVLLSKPEYDWEQRGFWVSEGGAVIKHDGRTFMTYSGSATDANYTMGRPYADIVGNLLNAPTPRTRIQALEWGEDGTLIFQSAGARRSAVFTGTRPEA